MDPTQAFDPNRTVATTVSPIQAPPMDPNRTMAVTPDAMPQTGGPAVQCTITPSREATIANGPAREQFLIELTSPSEPGLPGVAATGTRTPLNLCLVVDRSGSMEGPPLEYVKQACAYVVDMLTPNDVLSIVTFEETVDVLMAPQRVTNKEVVKAGISRLVPGNTTNLYDGISLALQQIASFSESARATRMIVLSDGDPTAGIKDFPSLVNKAAEIKTHGVTATFLGFGPDYNEELLASMAKKGGGNYYYIPRPELIPEIFRNELEKLISVSAQNLRLDIKLSRWVKLRGASGQAVVPADREFTIRLTDMERGATLHQTFDFEFANHPLGHYRVASGRLTYDDAMKGTNQTVDIDFIMEFTADSARYSAAPNPKVAQANDVAQASRAVERTVMGLKTGQLTGAMAVAELQKTQMLLMNEGRMSEAQEVTMALQALQTGDHGAAEKTLMGTVVQLDQGKTSS